MSKVTRKAWFRYSLRTLLLVVTAACLWLGWKTNEVRRQKQAVAALREAGCVVMYSHQYDENHRSPSNASPPGPEWLRRIIGDEYFFTVTYVQGHYIRDSELAYLKRFPNLLRLDVWGNQGLTETGIRQLGDLHSLESLHLMSCGVDDTTLKQFESLTNLRVLGLSMIYETEEEISGAGLESLQAAIPQVKIYIETGGGIDVWPESYFHSFGK